MTPLDGEVLNDMIRINADRIAGYQRAIAELTDLEDNDLRVLFQRYIDDSTIFVRELTAALEKMKLPASTGNTAMGKIYRAWMEIKAFFTGDERQTILNSCEAMEDAVKKAYESALNQPGLFPEIFELIKAQNKQLQKAHFQIKRLRDS
ncbi:PA2169 family four-helix-bundle protein [Niabella sp. CC-SYL272]|uniref:PA2169 family four-helix-bundle protein n=1 Tax=Niabella agricola TaxID=2891571 RepID=UPI001F3A277F|nr:PA2169 family four-helix-bundle protein [Niabella agricola]MCF3108796.1 PA2169 family four-helix-bundle protein [Niabella agricola]